MPETMGEIVKHRNTPDVQFPPCPPPPPLLFNVAAIKNISLLASTQH